MMIFLLIAVGFAALSFLGHRIADNSNYSRASQNIGIIMYWLAGAGSIGLFWVVIGYKICKYFRIV